LNGREGDLDMIEQDFKKSFEINVIGVLKTVHAFLPLIKKGAVRKVISISTGMADIGKSPYVVPCPTNELTP